MALGHEDFGLFGVIGSLAIFVTFLNSQFSGAIGRFYAFALGRAIASEDASGGLEECRYWFTTSVLIHTLLPTVLVGVGYPIGVKVISSGWLTIPPERIDTCIWLWRFVMISSFVAMVNVPFSAMYSAKQYIAELTVYSIIQVVVKTGFIYYMTTISRDWLKDYGLAMCIVAVVPQLLICWRAICVFPECRFRVNGIFDINRVLKLAAYAWWQAFCGIGYVARHQCMEIVVNRFFGPKVNASYTVGATVGGEAVALTAALNNAFSPALTTAYGAGDIATAKAFAFLACKFGTLLTLVFAIPMGLEIEEILRMWLRTPPIGAEGLCLCWLAVVVVEKFTLGHILFMNASGDVARFYLFRSLACLTAIPFSVLSLLIWKNVYLVGLALLLTTILVCGSDVIVAWMKAGISLRQWLMGIIVPLLIVSVVSGFVGLAPRIMIEASIGRVVLTVFVTVSTLLMISWFVLFDVSEKAFVRSRALNMLRKISVRKGGGR